MILNRKEKIDIWPSSSGNDMTSLEPSSIDFLDQKPSQSLKSKRKEKLGLWPATAIAGNDMSSSCLYVTGVCYAEAGQLTPISLLLVSAVLHLFRSVYAEVSQALPLNGGAYNVLLNTGTKKKAMLAGCLTILSYVCTAVISACSAAFYAERLTTAFSVTTMTISLLFAFAGLNIYGIAESAAVASLIFVFHNCTLLILIMFGFVHLTSENLLINLTNPLPHLRSAPSALFFGFSAGLLGVSGFETSANYIEQQAPGIFPKMLRNLWLISVVYNPVLSFLAMGLLSPEQIAANSEDLLSEMASRAGGRHLEVLVGLDAAMVLSGAVLTAYVGCTGLVRRMCMDETLPEALARTNQCRGTPHWIILGFFLLCASMFFVTEGDIDALASVYTIAFLGVMALFAVGNITLKLKRAPLPRITVAPWSHVGGGLLGVLIGLFGIILTDPSALQVFWWYLLIFLVPTLLMYWRLDILSYLCIFSKHLSQTYPSLKERLHDPIARYRAYVIDRPIAFLVKKPSPASLAEVVEYVLHNEQRRLLKLVHVNECPRSSTDSTKLLCSYAELLPKFFPQIKPEVIAINGPFGPDTVEKISDQLQVPKNFILIGCPTGDSPYQISELGVRIATHAQL